MQQNLTKIYILLFLFQSFAKLFAVFLKDIAMCFILSAKMCFISEVLMHVKK